MSFLGRRHEMHEEPKQRFDEERTGVGETMKEKHLCAAPNLTSNGNLWSIKNFLLATFESTRARYSVSLSLCFSKEFVDLFLLLFLFEPDIVTGRAV